MRETERESGTQRRGGGGYCMLLREWSVKTEMMKSRERKKASFEGQMRMTANCGREEERRKKIMHS